MLHRAEIRHKHDTNWNVSIFLRWGDWLLWPNSGTTWKNLKGPGLTCIIVLKLGRKLALATVAYSFMVLLSVCKNKLLFYQKTWSQATNISFLWTCFIARMENPVLGYRTKWNWRTTTKKKGILGMLYLRYSTGLILSLMCMPGPNRCRWSYHLQSVLLRTYSHYTFII